MQIFVFLMSMFFSISFRLISFAWSNRNSCNVGSMYKRVYINIDEPLQRPKSIWKITCGLWWILMYVCMHTANRSCDCQFIEIMQWRERKNEITITTTASIRSGNKLQTSWNDVAICWYRMIERMRYESQGLSKTIIISMIHRHRSSSTRNNEKKKNSNSHNNNNKCSVAWKFNRGKSKSTKIKTSTQNENQPKFDIFINANTVFFLLILILYIVCVCWKSFTNRNWEWKTHAEKKYQSNQMNNTKKRM